MTCDCMAKMDKALEPKNARLATAFQVTGDLGLQMRLCVATEKLDKAKLKSLPIVVANYCPFCGERLVP